MCERGRHSLQLSLRYLKKILPAEVKEHMMARKATKKRNTSGGTNRKTRQRMLGVFIFFLAVMVLPVTVHLFYIQIVQHEDYQSRAISQQMRSTSITPARGTIYDRNMKKLAVSATVETVVINPKSVKNEEQANLIADGLSEILGVDRQKVYDAAQKKNTYYVEIKKKVEKETADKVRKFKSEHKLSAIDLIEDTKRYYPYGNFASSVIGFVGTDNYGLQGVEAYYDDVLQGLPGKVVTAKNASGTKMPFDYETYVDPQNGLNLVLTLDEVVQHYAEKHLEEAVVENNVKAGGAVLVMDMKTGEILAMSNKPDYNLNDPFTISDEKFLASLQAMPDEEKKQAKSDYLNQQWRNKIISDAYEPGSTFKCITASMALEEKTVSLTSTFNCPGYYMVGKQRVSCWKHGGHGHEDFVKGLSNSCNPVFMQVGLSVGPEKFYEYFGAYGLREKTGIDLPGEASGVSHTLQVLQNPISLAVDSFGQTFKITPIQMITAISAATNGGNLVTPHVGKSLVDDNGNVVQSFDPTVKRQVISAETSAIVASMMEQVVSGGTGKNAYIQGYHIGGKTGTSEKIDSKDESGNVNKHIASFVGIAPANDPRYAVLVVLDEPPEEANMGGGAIAAPVAKAIFNDILPYLGVAPQYTPEELTNLEIPVPNVIGMSLSSAKNELYKSSLSYRIEGEGSVITDQMPKVGEKVKKGTSILLYTSDKVEATLLSAPNVVGKTPAEANKILEEAGLNCRFTGDGEGDYYAIKQSPEAGTPVSPGAVISVSFLLNTNESDQPVKVPEPSG